VTTVTSLSRCRRKQLLIPSVLLHRSQFIESSQWPHGVTTLSGHHMRASRHYVSVFSDFFREKFVINTKAKTKSISC
jgi:hypothetical protein